MTMSVLDDDPMWKHMSASLSVSLSRGSWIMIEYVDEALACDSVFKNVFVRMHFVRRRVSPANKGEGLLFEDERRL